MVTDRKPQLVPCSYLYLIYIVCSVLSVCMEYKDQMLTAKYIDLIRREAHFLTTPYGTVNFFAGAQCLRNFSSAPYQCNSAYVNTLIRCYTLPLAGRAAFYFFVGVLMVCKGGILDFVAGLFLAVIGVIIYHSSRKSYAALEAIRGQRHSEAELRARFRAYDTNKNGQLDSKELETALFLLDKDGNGEVSEEEFLNWYLGR
jgi:EF-hand domain